MKQITWILMIAAAALLARFVSAQDRGGFYERMEQAGVVEHGFDPLLRAVLPGVAASVSETREIAINAPPQSDRVNIYVVHPEQFGLIDGTAPPGFDTWAQGGEAIKGNLIAVPPNIVLMDDVYLGLLLLSSYSDVLAVRRSSDLDLEPGIDPLMIAGSWSKYMRLLTLEAGRTVQRNDIKQWRLSAYDRLSDETKQEAFFAPLLLVVGHELVHLRATTAGKSHWEILQTLDDPFAALKAEEALADQQSIRALKTFYAEKLARRSASTTAVPAFETLGVLAVADVLRDQTLADMFPEFHSLRASDQLVAVVRYGDACDRRSTAAGPILLEEVSHASERKIPLMTNTEFEDLSLRLRNETLVATHAHGFLRANQIIAALDLPGADKLNATETRLLDALLKQEPFAATPPDVAALLERRGLGITRETIAKSFKESIHWQQAVNCPPDMCALGVFEKKSGYVEIFGPSSNVTFIRLVDVLATPASRETFANRSEAVYRSAGVAVGAADRTAIREGLGIVAGCAGAYGPLKVGDVVAALTRLNASPFGTLEIGAPLR